MEIRTYARIVMRYWWVVLIATIGAGLAAAALDRFEKPVYSSHARVVLQLSPLITDTRTLSDLLGQMGGRYVSGTFAQSFTSDSVKAQSRKAAGLSDAQAVNYPYEANVLPDTAVIEVTGSGTDPIVLSNYLNAAVSATISDTQGLFRVVGLVPLEPARPPDAPSSPVPSRDIPTGVGLGLGLGVLLALALDYLRGSEEQRKRVAETQQSTTPASSSLSSPASSPATAFLSTDRD